MKRGRGSEAEGSGGAPGAALAQGMEKEREPRPSAPPGPGRTGRGFFLAPSGGTRPRQHLASARRTPCRASDLRNCKIACSQPRAGLQAVKGCLYTRPQRTRAILIPQDREPALGADRAPHPPPMTPTPGTPAPQDPHCPPGCRSPGHSRRVHLLDGPRGL